MSLSKGHKLLLHTQKELVDLDKEMKKKLNSRGLRLEKNVTKKNALIKNITLTFKRRKT